MSRELYCHACRTYNSREQVYVYSMGGLVCVRCKDERDRFKRREEAAEKRKREATA